MDRENIAGTSDDKAFARSLNRQPEDLPPAEAEHRAWMQVLQDNLDRAAGGR